MAKTLNQAGLARIGQIAEVSPQQLSLFAGKGARQLWEFAQGIDDRLVIPEAPAAKSWSSQETFTEDVTDEDWVLAKLHLYPREPRSPGEPARSKGGSRQAGM
jgi:nucleotidyltransferase/DNA polymerase involved in DNA repair